MGKLHLLDVGCADASVISLSGATFLVDCHNIEEHSHLLPSNKHLRGVFITHQHEDHYSGLGFLKDSGYTIDNLVYSPYERRFGDQSVTYEEWQEFSRYRDYFKRKGTKVHSPYRQAKFDEPWWNTNGIQFYIIGPTSSIARSDTREIHDACLVILVKLGKRRCLFTGDASDENLGWIASNTNNYCNDILHASHHGSINGAQIDFVKGCSSDYTVVSTKSGVYSNVPHKTAMQRYRNNTKKTVYRTDTDGSLTFTF